MKKNMLKREIFEMFTEKGMYLPIYQLGLLEAEVKDCSKKKGNVLALLNEMVKRKEYKQYADPVKGAYVVEKSNYFATVRKGILQIQPETGKVIAEYDSIYEAAKKFGGNSAAGNISKVIKGKYKTMYGYKWMEA